MESYKKKLKTTTVKMILNPQKINNIITNNPQEIANTFTV